MTLQSGLERFVSVPCGAVGWAGLTDTFAASWQVDWGWRCHGRFPRKSVTSAGMAEMAADRLHISAHALSSSLVTWTLILKERSPGVMASEDSKTVKADATRFLMSRTRNFVTF